MAIWKAVSLDPQNSPDANWYPELKNDRCALSPYYKSGNGIVISAVTNTTSCLDGFYQGWKDWCSNSKHAAGCIGNITLGNFPDTLLRAHQQYIAGAKMANNVSSPICPIGENAAFCLGWANNNTNEDEGCSEEPVSFAYCISARSAAIFSNASLSFLSININQIKSQKST